MRKIILVFLLLPFFSSAQIKLRPYVTGGYFWDDVRQQYSHIEFSYTFLKANTSGYFAGAGLNVGLPHLPIGFQLEAAYERHNLNYYFFDGTHVGSGYGYVIKLGTPYPPNPATAPFLKIAPAVTFNKFKRLGFSYGAELGAAYRMRMSGKTPVDNNYANLSVALHAGFSGIVVKAGYEYGITDILKTKETQPLLASSLYGLSSYPGHVKSSRINIGITIYPTVLIKG